MTYELCAHDVTFRGDVVVSKNRSQDVYWDLPEVSEGSTLKFSLDESKGLVYFNDTNVILKEGFHTLIFSGNVWKVKKKFYKEDFIKRLKEKNRKKKEMIK
jgi:hypothetical protein